MADDMEGHETTIASLAMKCREGLESLPLSEQNPWVKDQSAQFNIWVANAGVLGIGHRSLDFKLKELPDIKALIEQLLSSLERDIIKLQKPPVQARPAVVKPPSKPARTLDDSQVKSKDHEDSDGSSSSSYKFLSSSEEDENDSPATSLIGSQVTIQETIDRLQRLSTVIRRSGAHHQEVRIERFLQKPRNLQVYEVFEKFALQKAVHLFPQAEEYLQKRISQSIARRRSRFSYTQKHKEKISARDRAVNTARPKVAVLPKMPEGIDSIPLQKNVDAGREATGMAVEMPTIVGQSVLSVTENTKLDPKRLQAGPNDRPRTVISAFISQSGFPNPPKLKPGTKEFECPYCCLIYPASEARGQPWQQHVIRDSEPYFCVFKDCPNPFDPSDSFSGWIDHMETFHMQSRWECASADHGLHPLHFERLEDFEQHIRSHDEDITASLLATLSKHSLRKDPKLFHSCPFCGGMPEEIEKQFPEDNFQAQAALQKHVRDHLTAVALILPPIVADNVEGEGDGVTGSSPALAIRDSNLHLQERLSLPEIICSGNQDVLATKIMCDVCEETIYSVHYHCKSCNIDDWDMCMSCAGKGAACQSFDHEWVVRGPDGKIYQNAEHNLDNTRLPDQVSRQDPENRPPTASDKPVCDCRDVHKNSTHAWSSMGDILARVWNLESNGELALPTNFDDPSWPPESQDHLSKLKETQQWNWPKSEADPMVLKGGWECFTDKLAPYDQSEDPIIQSLLSSLQGKATTDGRCKLESTSVKPLEQNGISIRIDIDRLSTGVSWIWTGELDYIEQKKITTKQAIRKNLFNLAEESYVQVPSMICYDDNGNVSKWGSMIGPTTRNQTPCFTTIIWKEVTGPKQKLLAKFGKDVADLVADFLTCLWEHTVRDIKLRVPESVCREAAFRVIVTVPKTWEEEERRIVEQAVVQAGFSMSEHEMPV
ncbi:hypothetical protein BKA61DRAFT_306498 [Leptodontidium sp. MPI-SDFR-AT-0119]|nr:hypothetical protein BKA61DRAFT_306498 [Leptodontidium sp. MPI-SDFR-AT-0119]